MIRCVVISICLLLSYLLCKSHLSRYEMMNGYGRVNNLHIILQPHENDVDSVRHIKSRRTMYIGVPDHMPKYGYFIKVLLNGKQINSPIGFPGEESLTWVTNIIMNNMYTFVEHDYESIDFKTHVDIPILISPKDQVDIMVYSYANNHIYQISSFKPTILTRFSRDKIVSNIPMSYHTISKSIQAPSPPTVVME